MILGVAAGALMPVDLFPATTRGSVDARLGAIYLRSIRTYDDRTRQSDFASLNRHDPVGVRLGRKMSQCARSACHVTIAQGDMSTGIRVVTVPLQSNACASPTGRDH